ncbi:MAG: 1-deoxy-D-xylulose-5-phosphate reductoisomerase [Candidatus Cloacimonetes bacterium]|nr:1-deoxy-D-xylulose-5-phosphate reductoisomerase [Candidatus Cloacimonadota bacterium]
MKKIAVLGITGSIGASTVEVVRAHPDKFQIVLASAHTNQKKLFKLAQEFHIDHLVITSLEANPDSHLLDDLRLYFGEKELLQLITELDIDIVLNAITGAAGLLSSLTTIRAQKDLALANKESLVLAGHLIKKEMQKSRSRLLPVDSEHSAIFQCLASHRNSEIKKVILTASGGPFRTLPLAEFSKITVAQTLAHPTWSMGKKVTIDSATMMNKALEVIEAHWLFDLPYERIEAVLHQHSIIHSFLQFADGSILAQLSKPTMKLPILYALTHPQHIEADIVHTDILSLPPLEFAPLEKDRFPLFFLARKCGETGGLLPTIMNAVNEAAISLFLAEKIHYTDIYRLIAAALEKENNIENPDLETIITTNTEIHQKYLQDYKEYLN